MFWFHFSMSGCMGVAKIFWFFRRTPMNTNVECKWGRLDLLISGSFTQIHWAQAPKFREYAPRRAQYSWCRGAWMRTASFALLKMAVLSTRNLFATETVGVILWYSQIATHTLTVLTMFVNDRGMPVFSPCLFVFWHRLTTWHCVNEKPRRRIKGNCSPFFINLVRMFEWTEWQSQSPR